ncbi:hypothetical protein FQR65_LT08881 [Abscondita terminalis]|nr:hypothetical protein FQR65_LT08881 [Abscondita terminalis]
MNVMVSPSAEWKYEKLKNEQIRRLSTPTSQEKNETAGIRRDWGREAESIIRPNRKICCLPLDDAARLSPIRTKVVHQVVAAIITGKVHGVDLVGIQICVFTITDWEDKARKGQKPCKKKLTDLSVKAVIER